MISYLKKQRRRKELMEQLSRCAEEAKALFDKFGSYKNVDVKFADLIGGLKLDESTELKEGIFVVLKEVSESHFVIDCTMNQFSILSIHHHSDFDEKFEVISGEMHDMYTRNAYVAGDQVNYKAGTPHIPFAKKKTKLKIIGRKIK